MPQSSMLVTFAHLPPEKLARVAEGLTHEIAKLAPNEGVSALFYPVPGQNSLRARIEALRFADMEKMSDRVEELLTRLGGEISERVMT